MLSTENIASDIFHGCFVVTCTLFSFIGLVWLREQILHGGGPEWLERDERAPIPPQPADEPQNQAVLDNVNEQENDNDFNIFNEVEVSNPNILLVACRKISLVANLLSSI